MTLLERHAIPVLSEDDYRKLKTPKRFLTPEHEAKTIEPNCVYWDWAEYERVHQVDTGEKPFELRREKSKRKQIKFLLLRNVISGAAWLKATCAAREAKLSRSSREANGQVYGKKLTLGWIKLRYPGYDNMRTAPTLEQPKLLAALYPLLHEMDSLVAENLPEYHNFAFDCAMTTRRPDLDGDDLNRIADPHGHKVVQNLDPWGLTYTIRGTVFSTVEFNHNIIFKAHEDGHNVDGTLVCITTLDSYAGGRLVFPRYGYSAKLGPRDLLICDNNKELHGNLGPIAGDRYSVVAFLHDSVCQRASL